jgi:hypothetical protein
MPQLTGSTMGSDSHPLSGLMSQSLSPGSHPRSEQTPPTHWPWPPGGSHGVSHAPQWAWSSSRSEHAPLQQVSSRGQPCFGVHPGTQPEVPTSQTVPTGHCSSFEQPWQRWVERSHVSGVPPAPAMPPMPPIPPAPPMPAAPPAPPEPPAPLPIALQSASSLHPIAHVLPGVQYRPIPHGSFVGRHSTHAAAS